MAGVVARIWITDEGRHALSFEIDDHLTGDDHGPWPTLDEAKAAALPLMRATVIEARDEAENTVLDASRWLRENGGEP